ncbi:hypothetical protein CC1G_10780 [Coprinopsis cinerea okayama7|uniref:Uncharacterized protein n=1 Tax=Coprinopsis cinerea (strain Okayama-7 / 130 / ATCC MYA-4618 / FGSC 9003) TaxID=240176 RepID=A8NMF9_COPC7|nr:hypothetical protein CC1G_10780 [Coprinopsis cinerea okayama7\|eukprot:XP_001834906.2 hypothetical protein CC1G_10780 [Coprinopsis cinerea okayama7\
MDEFYDTHEAVRKLDEIIRGRRKTSNAANGVYQLIELNLDSLSVSQEGVRGAWFLCYNSEDTGHEAAYIRVQGIITSKLLPPVSRPENFNQMKKARPHMRQAVTLSGLGSKEFQVAVANVEKVYLHFYNRLPEGTLLPMDLGHESGDATLDLACRYFTHKNATFGQTQEVISSLVDPEGVLASLCDADFLYTANNIVDYKARTIQENGTVRYEDCSPAMFKVGDIVEATVVFACLPTKEKQFRMTFLLKALTQLNTDERNSAAILRMRSRFPNFNRNTVRKRKPTYVDDEEVHEARDRFCQMRIDAE